MTNSELILEVLDDIKPSRYCDDCLSDELQIKPRQQVNQICRGLEKRGRIAREKDSCSLCNKQKITNAISFVARPLSTGKKTSKSSAHYSPSFQGALDIDIETLRTKIVRICRAIWSKRKKEIPPRSISIIINILKSEEIIPQHQANMMLTLCSMRNVYVYESFELGQRENSIASNAWSIVSEWWSDFH